MIRPGTVLLHDTLNPAGRNMLFEVPREVLIAHTAAEARDALARLDTAGREGLWAAGYLSYELGFLFEERLAPLLPERTATPLLWFGLYGAVAELTRAEADAWLVAEAGPAGEAVDVVAGLDEAAYARAFDRVEALIAAGDTYQVNLTFKARFALDGDAVALYRDLARKQPVAYGALIRTEDHWVLSRSPELFIARKGDRLFARPMKGTMRRGRTLAEDATQRLSLAADEKNRAENLMIVDLLRNDLGRIAEIGSVRVTDLFTVETYRSLHTMTSGIEARGKPGLSPVDILANLFPCGSITGAPKLRAMEIIHEVETEPRGLYTGAVGYVAPSGDLAFNVAIRTASIGNDGSGEIGIGGGIVADSRAADEYREALLKMKFLTDPAEPVCLIETMLWTRESGFYLHDRHLDRLGSSAVYFGIPISRSDVVTLLTEWAASVDQLRYRVRLTLDESEGLALTATPLPEPAADAEFRFVIARERLDSQSPWLAHKTTNRARLDEPRQRAQALHGVDEVVFLNEHDELTEGSITSLFIERDDVLLTPPLAAGLLPGTLRAELIATGQAREARLTLADLETAEAIYLGNSVRGLMRARWSRPET
ncbi:aminodeoxychorismate synthase component I [Devosia nitrariae]|uniref:Probable branched-chain-amino-acid aminotransferase n=1 Tax=Devosia nitrariae TaxID=2071872 RepID=A0ABQ5WEF7_9HYPH|nr:aminodeoxychorismate synthase component I [Devosia nitrariae]GLQ58174.1 aminodeoxychorismate synthase, component I [Devosia nitrariae]